VIRIIFEFSLPFDEDDTFLILSQEDVQDHLGKSIDNVLYGISEVYRDGLRLGDISSKIRKVTHRDGKIKESYGDQPLGASRERLRREGRRTEIIDPDGGEGLDDG